MINHLIEVLNALWEWNASLIPHHGHDQLALPPLIIAGVVAAGAAAYKGISGSNQRKRAIAAQKKIDYRNKVANGASILAQDEQYALPEYDDDPFSNNERRLYALGDPNASSTGMSNGASAGMSILSSGVDIFNTVLDNKAQRKELAYQVNKPIINNDLNRFAQDAQKDQAYRNRQLLNDPYQYAFGGRVVKNSSDTAMVDAGTHESGNDMPFVRPDGSKASVEGGEGLRKTANGVNVFSDRIAVPGENVSIADKFKDLSFLKGNLEKASKTTGNGITRTTAEREIAGLNASMDALMNVQEGLKTMQNFKGDGQQYGGGARNAILDYSKVGYSNAVTDYIELDGTDGKKQVKSNSFNGATADEAGTYTPVDPLKPEAVGRYAMTKAGHLPVKVPDASKLVVIPGSANDPRGKINPATKVSFGKRVANTLGTDNSLNAITTGLTLLDNINNARLLKKLGDVDFRYVNPVELDKEYDVSAQEHSVKKELDNFYKNVDKNTTSSVVGLNVKLAAMAEGIDKLNQVYNTKEKFETEMKNQEILTNSKIEAGNAETYNRGIVINRENFGAKSANFSNAIDDVVNGIIRGQGMARDKERFAIQEGSIANTGVNIANLKNGGYKEMGADRIAQLMNISIASGNLSYNDYVNGVNAHNTKAAAGSVLKVMSESEFNAIKGKVKKS